MRKRWAILKYNLMNIEFAVLRDDLLIVGRRSVASWTEAARVHFAKTMLR